MTNFWLAFLTGLTTGGLSCLAVQGGLLASSINPTYNKKIQVATFIFFKLIAYTILGAVLGKIGTFFSISPKISAFLQILVGFYMLATAARLLDLHPIFRYLVIQPPAFIYKKIKSSAQSQSLFSPAVLGLSTILLPCGVTQAMMILAATSGSIINGALIMLFFILGTSPIFFVLGLAVTELFKKKAFLYLASALIIVLGIISINNGQNLRGSFFTIQNFASTFSEAVGGGTVKNKLGNQNNGYQEATVNISTSGYTSDTNSLKVNVPVKLTLVTNNTLSCARAFTIPSQNISIVMPVTGTKTIEFTPTNIGRLVYVCSMGMYTGSFNIVN